MVKKIQDGPPALPCLTCQYIFYHAREEGLYEQIINEFRKRAPRYNEAYLLNTRNWILQNDFYQLLTIYKELSGQKDPQAFAKLGEIIPTITSDSLIKFGQLILGPKRILKMSPSFSRRLNNDQEVEVKKIRKEGGDICALIYHYNHKNKNPYLEMVTAAYGYWIGMYSLWGSDKRGDIKEYAIQIPLERIIEHDYRHLSLHWRKEGNRFLINNKVYAERCNIFGNKQSFTPDFLLLDKEAREEIKSDCNALDRYFEPFIILEDLIAERGDKGEKSVIFHKGRIYGNPCTIYEVKLPSLGFLEKLKLISKMLNPLMLKKSHKGILAATLEANRTAYDEMLEEARERMIAEETIKRMEDTLKAKTQELYSFFSSYEKFTKEIEISAHDAKAKFRAINYILNILKNKITLPSGQEELEEGIRKNILDMAELCGGGLKSTTAIMSEALPLTLEEINYILFIKQLHSKYSVLPCFRDIVWESSIQDINIMADRDKLSTAFFNILENCTQAMQEPKARGKRLTIYTSIEEKLPCLIEQISPDPDRLQRESKEPYLVTAIEDQGGGVNDDTLNQLNLGGKIDSKKESGTGVGSKVAFDVVRMHKGRIFYSQKDSGGMLIKIYIPIKHKGHS